MRNNFNFIELSRAAGRINRDKHVSRLVSEQVFNVFSSIDSFPPVKSKCSNSCDCGENTPSYGGLCKTSDIASSRIDAQNVQEADGTPRQIMGNGFSDR